MTCIGEPISWLRLEQAAVGEGDVASVERHVAACAACRSCWDEIRGDVVAMPGVPAPRIVPMRRRWVMPAFAAAVAMAAVIAIVVRPRSERDERVSSVKGVGELVIGVVRERNGAIAEDATTFQETDRWKVVVTCPPEASAWVDVAVVEVGGPPAPDYPMAASRVACGNRVALPGAFRLTGKRPNRVCVVASADGEPARGRVGDDAACITITP